MYVTNRVGEIKAMNDKDFKAFINDQSWELNKKTIEAMMEKELEVRQQVAGLQVLTIIQHLSTMELMRGMFKKSMLILLMLV